MNVESVLAKKYATAFLNVTSKQFDTDELGRVVALQKFLRNAHELLFFFNLPLIEHEVSQKVIDMLFAGFKTEHVFKKLMNMLCEERRAFLVPVVLGYIASIYRERHNMMKFTVASAQAMSDNDKKTVHQFLEERTQKAIDAEYAIDPTLLAGMRALSGTLLWEHSVRKQLMMMQQSLIEQGIQWN